jgi:hypothetical protein
VNRGRITRAATSLPLHCARSDAERGGELADPGVALFQRLPDRGIGRRGDGRPTERLALGASPLQARLHARKMGLEGIVSKRLTAPYRSGPSRDWIKVKNPGAVVAGAIHGITRKALSCMVCGAAGGEPMSIDAEEAKIRAVIVSALTEHSEASERGVDALFAMRQAEAIVRALKIGGYEIKRVSR